MAGKKNEWTVERFRELLKDYLTDPPFAESVTMTADNALIVQLDEGGGRFHVLIAKVP